ncbi:MAG: VOC family protein [Gemmatimonadales bacterium]
MSSGSESGGEGSATLSVLETSIYAGDLEAAERFYREVLGFTVHSRRAGRHVFFRVGGGMFLVFNPESTGMAQAEVGGQTAPPHGAAGAGHVAFRIEPSELSGWRQRLARYGVAIEAEVEWPRGGRSIYFRDPAGNSLELAPASIWGIS